MSTSLHIPEGLLSFHLSSLPVAAKNPVTALLKRVVSDLQKWLNCSWTAGLVPTGLELVPELQLVCVEGNPTRPEIPDLICPIPGASAGGLAAIVAAGPRNDGAPYSEEDHRFADALCGHLGEMLGAPDTSSLTDREIFDRLDHYRLQPIPGLEYSGLCHRANHASGDFFDLLPRGEHDLVIAIGSVAARGLPAGIMLGGTLASVRAFVARGESLARIAVDLNRTLWELSPEDSFTSFFCAQVDPSAKCLRYVNAGHEPALVLRKNGRVDRLDATGAVLGLSHRSPYRELVVPFEPGDLLAAFTDGVADATGPAEVLRILRAGPDCGVQDLATHVLAAGDTAADRTVVLVRSSDVIARPSPLHRHQLVAA